MPTVDFNLVPVSSSTDFEVGWGPLVQKSFISDTGDTLQVTLGKRSYTGTTYSETIKDYSLSQGRQQESTLTVRRSSLGQVRILTEDTALIQELKSISGAESRKYRLEVTRGGATEFIGWVIPSATSTKKNENGAQVITVRAKDRLLSLDQDYDLRGSSETVTYGTAIADILATLGLDLPIKVQMQWRPASMALTDDPLSIQVPGSAWYRTDTDGIVRPLSRGEVLDDLVGTLGCQIVQRNGAWTLMQPTAHRSGSTVTEWSYTSAGALDGTSATRPATVDITSEPWEKGSDEVSSQNAITSAFVEYEHNAPQLLDFNGDFNEVTSSEPDDWVWWANDGTQASFGTNFTLETGLTVDGGRALSIEGSQALSTDNISDYKQYVDRFAEIAVGFLADSAGGATINLQARRRFTDNAGTGDPPVEPGPAQTYWALRLDGDTGTYFWVEGSGWTLEGDLTTDEELNEFDDLQLGGNYQEQSFDVDEAPTLGTLYLRVYEAIARPQDTGSADDDAFRVYALWDACTIAPQKSPTGVTTYRSFDAASPSGQADTYVTRLGDGPYAGSDGALLDDGGITTNGWTVDGGSIAFELGELQAKTRMSLLREDPATERLTMVRPSSVPQIDRAVQSDGTRYWPISIKRQEPRGRVQLYTAELVDEGYPSGYEAYAGRADLVESGGSLSSGSGDSGVAAGVSSFNSRTGQVELQSSDVTGALGYTPQGSASPGVTALDGKQGDIEVEAGVLDIPDTSPPTLEIVDDGIDASKISFISVDTSTTPDSYTIAGNLRVQGFVDADGEVSAFDSGPGSSSGGGSGSVAVEDSLTSINTDVSTLNFGNNLSVTDDGSGQVTIDASASSAPVDSVFGRTGAVTAESGDYSASQITNFDADAVSAVNAETTLSVDISGNAATADNATQLGGQAASNYARTDVAETFAATVTANNGLEASTITNVSSINTVAFDDFARTDIAETFSESVTINGYTFDQDVSGDMTVTTPAGNTIKLFNNGDVGAFQ